jgi:hypothetical protein
MGTPFLGLRGMEVCFDERFSPSSCDGAAYSTPRSLVKCLASYAHRSSWAKRMKAPITRRNFSIESWFFTQEEKKLRLNLLKNHQPISGTAVAQ